MPDPFLHRFEVAHHEPDVVQDRRDAALEVVGFLGCELTVELEVHHRLSMARVAPGHHALDSALLVADRADHRVQQTADAEAPGEQLLLHGVDEEGRVVGIGLDDRSDRFVPVGRRIGIEDPNRGRVGAAAVGELERRQNESHETVDPRGRELVGRQPSEEHLRERRDGVTSLRLHPLIDRLEQRRHHGG